MNPQHILVENINDLKYLYERSAMTWEGLREEDWDKAAELVGAEGCKVYITKGAVMNCLCHLTGSNAYPDDLNIVSIDKYHGLAIKYGARWMDDIIDNNARREGHDPF